MLLSLVSTVICLLLAYPLGLILKKSGMGQKGLLVFLFVLPMWMNFLLAHDGMAGAPGEEGRDQYDPAVTGILRAAPDQYAGCDRDGYGLRFPSVHGTADL